ncbi:carbohydrate ABC transporter permease [Paenibacillus sp. GCM10027626]|uniref:carbohydrate ABC transporter permease n=1 Tax=Paenibacillus sp. GCM10027626 TaxID=3273411 RepID=UPI00362B5746
MSNNSKAGMVFDVFNVLIMAIIAVSMLYPLLYIFSYSISDASIRHSGLMLLPRGFSLEGYRQLLNTPGFANALWISVSRTVAGPIIMIAATGMAAYCLTREEVVGVTFFRKFFVFTMYFSSGLIPSYILAVDLKIAGTFWIYILPLAVNVFNMVLIKTYIESIPKSLGESAIVDGANDVVVFWKIILPVCAPVMGAVALFSAVQQWNSFIDTQIYNSMRPNLFTLQYLLYMVFNSAQQNQADYLTAMNKQHVDLQSLRMSIAVINILPIMAIYPFLQKYFVKGLLIGAVKG